jgi:hypothetical protein
MINPTIAHDLAKNALVTAEKVVRSLIAMDAAISQAQNKLFVRERLSPESKYFTSRLPEENRKAYNDLQAKRPARSVLVEGIEGIHAGVSFLYPQNRTVYQNHGVRVVYRLEGKVVTRKKLLEALVAKLLDNSGPEA